MSWTKTPGHRPVGPVYRERPVGQPDAALGDVTQMCFCGKPLYGPEHLAELATVLD